MPDLRIVIADDHDLIRRGVRDLLSECKEWQIVGEACNGEEAVEKVADLRPDVAIVDFSMPILNGPQAVSKIALVSPDTSVVVLTMHDSEHVIRGVLESGAKGFVLKTDADNDLIAAVEAVTQKRHFFTRRVASVMLDEYLMAARPQTHRQSDSARLTLREREVLQLLADGVTSKQIADKLKISVRTVESHRMHINRKLGFATIADLVRYAIRHGMVAQN